MLRGAQANLARLKVRRLARRAAAAAAKSFASAREAKLSEADVAVALAPLAVELLATLQELRAADPMHGEIFVAELRKAFASSGLSVEMLPGALTDGAHPGHARPVGD